MKAGKMGHKTVGQRLWKPERSGPALALLLFSVLYLAAPAQEPTASAKLKTELIRIGEQTEITLKVSYDKSKGIRSVQFPLLKDTITRNIEIISQSKVETYAPDKNNPSLLVDSQTLTITCFDSGYYAIPPFRFFVNSDPSRPLESEALMLGVNTVKADTTKAPKDIKPPLEEPYTFADALPYILATAAAVAVIAGLILLFRRHRKKPIVLIPKAPPVPAHIVAMKKLTELYEKKLWQEGKLKEYHSAISDILREYIERTFPCNAMELTTEEIMLRFRRINIPKEVKSNLKYVLVLSDMVKFAKEVPMAEENELSYTHAVAFVQATSKKEAQTEPVPHA